MNPSSVLFSGQRDHHDTVVTVTRDGTTGVYAQTAGNFRRRLYVPWQGLIASHEVDGLSWLNVNPRGDSMLRMLGNAVAMRRSAAQLPVRA